MDIDKKYSKEEKIKTEKITEPRKDKMEDIEKFIDDLPNVTKTDTYKNNGKSNYSGSSRSYYPSNSRKHKTNSHSTQRNSNIRWFSSDF